MRRFICSILLVPCTLVFLSFTSQDSKTLASKDSKKQLSKNEFSDWESRLELARVLSYLKRYDESLTEYQKLLETQPDSLIARLEMIKILFYQEKTEKAFDELSKIPPQNIDDATWLVIADVYRKEKKYKESEDIYFQYLMKNPDDDSVRLKLAEQFSWEKRYNESIHEYQVILSHHPDDIQVRRHYAQVLTWMGKDEEAIEEWKKTLELPQALNFGLDSATAPAIEQSEMTQNYKYWVISDRFNTGALARSNPKLKA